MIVICERVGVVDFTIRPRPGREARATELALGEALLRKVLVAAARVAVRNFLRAVRRLDLCRGHQALGRVRQMRAAPRQEERQRAVLVLKVVVRDALDRQVSHVTAKVLRVGAGLAPLPIALRACGAALRWPVRRVGQKLVARVRSVEMILVAIGHCMIEDKPLYVASIDV